MRVNLSHECRTHVLGEVCFGLLIFVAAAAFCIWAHDKESILYVMLPALVDIGILYSTFFSNRRLLSYSLLEQDKVSAYTFFNKPLCTVDTSKPVFYSIFLAVHVKYDYKMIAISNEPYECWKNVKDIKKKRFIYSYDRSKIIIFPYEDKVMPFLNLEEWHLV